MLWNKISRYVEFIGWLILQVYNKHSVTSPYYSVLYHVKCKFSKWVISGNNCISSCVVNQLDCLEVQDVVLLYALFTSITNLILLWPFPQNVRQNNEGSDLGKILSKRVRYKMLQEKNIYKYRYRYKIIWNYIYINYRIQDTVSKYIFKKLFR